ncbi:bifunctional lysylphosphatidylglycerol flippase/synthetase MprF [Arhodomonas aquaeolei]|uniref:bifunctional lysylphosphatidylglycerol flippase/synthetase MprF n=1 Tax=Arhodomonas aquaeolei TaxID=2369 RepID=UPI0021693C5A|nr:bifunctional lysylphosphatidylglycerol flippase/synthetase MprF [Arhodomonas aquaeolei]MCS4504450.1 bifunctional lysylphosphatidylglycerol flippase/synthetase MprF [Arhodomonas aquaeolei]
MPAGSAGQNVNRHHLVWSGISLVLFLAALAALHHLLAEVRIRDIGAALKNVRPLLLGMALAATVASYCVLTVYEVLSLHYVRKPLPYRQLAVTAFISYAFSHNIGLPLLTGGSIRYRIYSAAGLSGAEIATVTGFSTLTFGLGAILLLAVALTFEPATLAQILPLPAAAARLAGITLLGVTVSYTLWTALRRSPIRLHRWQLAVPAVPVTLTQFALGVLDIGFAATALYILLPADATPTLPAFVGIYTGAMVIAILSHSPGGVGVFEALMLIALPDGDSAAVVAALLVYRVIYYLLPFALAAILLASREVTLRWPRAAERPSWPLGAIDALVPPVMAAAVFLGGLVLLISSATPTLGGRLAMLRDVLPLPFVEASHLLSSIVGLWLLLLAHGLLRRLDSAWQLTVLLLTAAIPFSLLKGLDWEEALIAGVVLTCLVMARSAFFRKGSLTGHAYTRGWLALVLGAIALTGFVSVLALRHVPYEDSLWWQFAFDADASRILRTQLVVVVLTSTWVLRELIRPAPPFDTGKVGETADVARLVASATRTGAALALTGDKRFLLNPDRNAFIMYRIQGRSWISLGDPVGPDSAWPDIVWRFRELCDLHAGRPVFYQVPPTTLPLYLDLGLAPLKLGEEARVDLADFSLQGHRRSDLRHSARRAEREGAEFAIAPRGTIDERLIGEMGEVSRQWLDRRGTREKGFSLGHFSPAYLRLFDCATVRRNGRLVAFANLLTAPAGGELSVDLMRHGDDAPYGVMDYLFTHLMLWGQEAGYRWFNLGMAPLSGLDDQSLGPTWQRLGTLLFEHGEHFYNFRGLRRYKEKYAPVWEPRYLIAPSGLALPRALIDVATLIAGGNRGLVLR